MNWFKKNEEVKEVQQSPVVVAEMEVEVPVSMPITPQLSSDESSEYIAVATRIGMNQCGPVLNQAVERCLLANSIEVYNAEAVVRFLDSKLGKGKWLWAALRPTDAKHLGDWYLEIGDQKINFSENTYNRPVPLPVLLTVEKIMTAVPEAHFYVSQSKDENADPFLLVTSRTMRDYIVERWDEPDFRER